MDHQDNTNHGLERLVFFSDAVIAIAITLLVLDLRLPNNATLDLAAQLRLLIPRFISFVSSFFVIGVLWEAHHRLFIYVRSYDRLLIWLNLLFLFFIVLLPFPTTVMGQEWSVIAAVFYAGTLTLLGLVRLLVLLHVESAHLLSPDFPPRAMKVEKWRSVIMPLIFLVSIPLARYNLGLVPLCWLLTVPAAIIGRRVIAR